MQLKEKLSMQIFSGGKAGLRSANYQQLKFRTEGYDVVPTASLFFINQTYANETWYV